MTKFNIEIHHANNVFEPSILIQMEPKATVMEVAQKLSTVYPGQTVTVGMFARTRRTYKDGECISSNPELEKFYSNVDPQDAWDWSCFGKVTD